GSRDRESHLAKLGVHCTTITFGSCGKEPPRVGRLCRPTLFLSPALATYYSSLACCGGSSSLVSRSRPDGRARTGVRWEQDGYSCPTSLVVHPGFAGRGVAPLSVAFSVAVHPISCAISPP